jgi:predicted DNA-binding transcriptional regulator YafY
MRRADRLFQLIQALRSRRVATARQLAALFDVSERTIYRDVRDLQLSGVPIEGEAGVGYVLRAGSDIPPLMFTPDELEALVVGARMVEGLTTTALAAAARQALLKIEAVLPPDLQAAADGSRLFVSARSRHTSVAGMLDLVNVAIQRRAIVRLHYRERGGQGSGRDVRPFCLEFRGVAWYVGAWCELRRDFRSFRLDRVEHLSPTGRSFEETPGISLAAYLRRLDDDRPAPPRPPPAGGPR